VWVEMNWKENSGDGGGWWWWWCCSDNVGGDKIVAAIYWTVLDSINLFAIYWLCIKHYKVALHIDVIFNLTMSLRDIISK
jgi:hypothetical protein